jgi:hypothetical protein
MPQLTVNNQMALGVPGEIIFDGSKRSQPFQLESNGVPNIVGATAYTVVSEGVAMAGGTGYFAGILANPKVYASIGTTVGGPLAPTMQLPDGDEAELVTETSGLVITTPDAGNIGDNIIFNNATGALSILASGTVVPGGSTLIPGASVTRFTVSAAGLAVIEMTGQRVNTV